MRRHTLLLGAVVALLVAFQPASAKRDDARRYDGPIFDAMAQMDERVFPDLPGIFEAIEGSGVQKILLFSRDRRFLGENEGALLDLRDAHPGLVVLGSPKDFSLDGDLPGSYIDHTLAGIVAHDYRCIGEILYRHGDKDDGRVTPTGESVVDPQARGTHELVQRNLAGPNVPLMVHWEFYKFWSDLPAFGCLFATYPDQKFILPHFGFGHPWQAALLLRCHPNVYFTISKKTNIKENYADPALNELAGPPLIDDRGRLLPAWRFVLMRHADRCLFATDAHKEDRWSEYAAIVSEYRDILGQLPPRVARQIAFENAESLYGVAIDD
jgi:hypothetical protein